LSAPDEPEVPALPLTSTVVTVVPSFKGTAILDAVIISNETNKPTDSAFNLNVGAL
jgi:hypothetical protein